MAFFGKKNNKKKVKEHPNTVAYKKMLKERNEIKTGIMEKLEAMNFTPEEMAEVFGIINKYQALLELAKKPLINITPDVYLNKVEDEVKERVKALSAEMVSVLRLKVAQILERRKHNG